jgi:aromatic ring-opening dioxygenase catalytic subunit (LigB family)
LGAIRRAALLHQRNTLLLDSGLVRAAQQPHAGNGAMKRRQALQILGGTLASASLPSLARKGARMKRMPVVYLPHGGGPWPFVELGFADRREVTALADYLRGLPVELGVAGSLRGLLVISAHWEEPVPTVMTGERPPLYYDYYGFPPESYTLTWPAPGDPRLAARVAEFLGAAGLPSATDPTRGFDHGTFIPLKLSFPAADVPTVQLSLIAGLDPARHLALGRALAPLRDEGVLIVGSGMSYHNLREFKSGRAHTVSEVFDAWLREAALADGPARARHLEGWAAAPAARQAHPREEHLLPLMVVAGAAGADAGRLGFEGTFSGARLSAFHYG